MKSAFRTIFWFLIAIIMMANQLLMADETALDKNPAVEQLGAGKFSIAQKPLIPRKKPIIVNLPPGPKGQVGPAVVTYAQMTLDKEILKVELAEEGAEGDSSMPYPMREGFESPDWCEKWSRSSDDCTWGRTKMSLCPVDEPYKGTYSAWPFAVHLDLPCGDPENCPQPCEDDYPNNANSWMIYGPFSLVGVTGETWLEFALNLQSELGYDYIKYMASIDGSSFYGYGISGNTGGWVDINPI